MCVGGVAGTAVSCCHVMRHRMPGTLYKVPLRRQGPKAVCVLGGWPVQQCHVVMLCATECLVPYTRFPFGGRVTQEADVFFFILHPRAFARILTADRACSYTAMSLIRV